MRTTKVKIITEVRLRSFKNKRLVTRLDHFMLFIDFNCFVHANYHEIKNVGL